MENSMALPKQNTKARTLRKKTEDSVAVSSRIKPIKSKQSRIKLLQLISDATGLKRVEVEAVFTEMSKLVKAHMKKQGSGEIMLPKLGIKIRKIRRKPTKRRVMVSPLTGQEVVIAPKPARDDIKLIALKGLKESIIG